VNDAIAHRDSSTDYRVWFRYMLVRIRNVAPARHQAGQRRTGQSHRIICQAAENKPMELLGRGADGRNRPTISVGKIARIIWLISDPNQIGDELLPTEIGDLDIRIGSSVEYARRSC
jgi:hypothetical protein